MLSTFIFSYAHLPISSIPKLALSRLFAGNEESGFIIFKHSPKYDGVDANSKRVE
jgi:hypothetical protein